MDTNLKQIFRSELFNAYSYADRLFHALNDLAELNYHPGVRNLNQQLTGDLGLVLEKFDGLPISIKKTSYSSDTKAVLDGAYKVIDSIFFYSHVICRCCDSFIHLLPVLSPHPLLFSMY